MKRDLYPADWEAIALAVKAASDWRCEECGQQCRRPGEKFDTHTRTLTTAHLNHVPSDCRPENLKAMCAPCHLRYDAPHHAKNAAETRLRGKAIADARQIGFTATLSEAVEGWSRDLPAVPNVPPPMAPFHKPDCRPGTCDCGGAR